jgi:hypothetical protein
MDGAHRPVGGIRSALGQVTVVGLVCFCSAGMFNATVSVTGGIDPCVASAATATLYTTFTASALLSPAACNAIGPRASLALGSLGYVGYCAALVEYRSHPVAAPVVAAGALNGLCAGLLWTAQGQVSCSLPALP